MVTWHIMIQSPIERIKNMPPVIRLSDEIYTRLEKHASGFSSPSSVVEKLLNHYENKPPIEHVISNDKNNVTTTMPIRLEICYFPENSEKKFKEQLLKVRVAHIKMYYIDGTTKINEWLASRMKDSSSVDVNLRSGYFREWKKKGIYKAEISTDISDLR